jgi:uncharacterized protein
MNPFTKRIAQVLGLPEKGVDNTLALLEDGCTIPFISRYRKERTGGLDEVQITRIADMNDKLKELVKRKETIVKTITEQEKMTAELQKRIDDCWDATELEDIYLPSDPSAGRGLPWRRNRVWSRWPLFCSCSGRRIPNRLPNGL